MSRSPWSLVLLLAACVSPPPLEPETGHEAAEPEPVLAATSASEETFVGPLPVSGPPAPVSDAAVEPPVETVVTRATSEAGWELRAEGPYRILSQLDDARTLDALEVRALALHARLERDLPGDPGGGAGEAATVRVFRDLQGFLEHGGARGSTAFYSSLEREVVVAYASEASATTAPDAALQHILVHEYLLGELGLQSLPPWLLYGLAELYGGMELEEGELRLPRVEPRLVEEVLHRSPPPSLELLLGYNESEFLGRNDQGLSAYAAARLAWSLAYFLEVGREEAGAWHPSWEGLLARCVEAAREAPPGTEALAVHAVCSEVDLGALDAAWRLWLGVYAEASQRRQRARQR